MSNFAGLRITAACCWGRWCCTDSGVMEFPSSRLGKLLLRSGFIFCFVLSALNSKCTIACSNAARPLKEPTQCSAVSYFYIYIHSCMLKRSLDPPKSHGEFFRFCFACCSNWSWWMYMCSTYVPELIVFLQNDGIPGLMMRFLHLKEQLNMEVLIYDIWSSLSRRVADLSVTNTRVRRMYLHYYRYAKISCQMLLIPQSDWYSLFYGAVCWSCPAAHFSIPAYMFKSSS